MNLKRGHLWFGRSFVALSITSALVATSACSSSSGGGSGSTNDNGKPSSVSKYTDLSALEAAAKKEGGTLNLYIAPEYAEFLVKPFEKLYSFAHLNVTQLEPADAVTKFTTEFTSGIDKVDIVQMHDSQLSLLTSQHSLQAIGVPNDSLIPAGLMPAGSIAHPMTILPNVFLYNTRLLKSPPKDLADLSESAWSGKLAMDTPSLLGPGGSTLALEEKPMGTANWIKWLGAIKNNSPYLTDTDSTSYAAVVRGDRELCICHYSDFIGQKKGTPVAVGYYNQDSTGILTPSVLAGISSKAPHPAMAALWSNWLESESGGQLGFAQSGRTPVVPVKGYGSVSVPADIKAAPSSDVAAYLADGAKYSALFKQAFGS